jgi:uncharacterized protein DUF6879
MACMADAVPMSEAQLDEIERRLIGACRVAPPPWVEGLETLDDCLRQRTRSALHLELRDAYTLSDPLILAWKAGQRADPQDRALWRPWLERMQEVTGRGVDVRRARIVSEPVSEYIPFEYDITFMNLAAGEKYSGCPDARPPTSRCQATTSGSSTTNWRRSTTSAAPASGWTSN